MSDPMFGEMIPDLIFAVAWFMFGAFVVWLNTRSWKGDNKMKCEALTEQEMREAKVPWPKTQDELMEYIQSLVEREHDYGTCVYAMSMAAVAAYYYVAHKLGVTGFQASCADLDILRRTRDMKHGFRIIDYEKLLYPQYLTPDHFPSVDQLLKDNIDWLSEEAKRLLDESPNAHPDVKGHWKRLAERRV